MNVLTTPICQLLEGQVELLRGSPVAIDPRNGSFLKSERHQTLFTAITGSRASLCARIRRAADAAFIPWVGNERFIARRLYSSKGCIRAPVDAGTERAGGLTRVQHSALSPSLRV